MHTLYNIVIGPLAWLAGAVFVLGIIYRLASMFRLARKRDPLVLEYMSLKYGLRSILAWSIPFFPVNSRRHPVVTVVTFLFHISLLLTPIFLMAHVLLWDYYHGIDFPSLPDAVADVLTMVVIGACVFFGVRRVRSREVRYVTTFKDWAILVLVALPFITGFLAYHQIGNYRFMIIMHILSGELWLAAIPFTRLSHMILAPWSRAYIGSEFGAVRHAKDW
jgi:nitrate reductase gamma subunit